MKPFIALASGGDFAVARAAGWRPLGPVLGASVMLDGTTASSGLDGGENYQLTSTFRDALTNALGRMKAEAKALGANVVADVEFRFPAQFEEEDEHAFLQLQMMGTAYSAPIQTRSEPIITNLTAVDVSKLVQVGYEPVGLCVGYAFTYQGLGFRSANLRAYKNAEHPDFARATAGALEIARQRLDADAIALAADGVVGFRFHHRRLGEKAAGTRYFRIVMTGTAVKRDPFSKPNYGESPFVIDLSDGGKS